MPEELFWASWNLEFALNWTKSQNFDMIYNFFGNVIVQIQTRHIKDHLEEKKTLSFTDWKLIMFDHEGIKIAKVTWSLSIQFSKVKSKKLVTKKNMRLKDLTCTISINLQFFKNSSTIFQMNF